MSILDDLLEYEDPSLEGTPLEILPSVKEAGIVNPLNEFHLRYHRTKASLYVVLSHAGDGSLQQFPVKYSDSGGRAKTTPRGRNHQSYLGDGFSAEETCFGHNQYDHRTNLVQSITSHCSGVSVIYSVDEADGYIRSVELQNASWRFKVEQPNSDTPYRCSARPKVEGKADLLGEVIFSSHGNEIKPAPQIEDKPLDFEATLFYIISLIEDQRLPKDYKSNTLNSLNVLIYK